METFRYQICLLWNSVLIRALQGLTSSNLRDSCQTLTYEPRPHLRMPGCSEICFEVVSVLPYDSDQQLCLGNSRLAQIAGPQRLFGSSGSLKSTPSEPRAHLWLHMASFRTWKNKTPCWLCHQKWQVLLKTFLYPAQCRPLVLLQS